MANAKSKRLNLLTSGISKSIGDLGENLKADFISDDSGFDESKFSSNHLLLESDGWEKPDHEIVNHYFNQLKKYDSNLSDAKISELIGLSGNRRIRAFRSGERAVPYNIWRKILLMMGKVPQDVIKVIAIFE